jgi:hypothetical protein
MENISTRGSIARWLTAGLPVPSRLPAKAKAKTAKKRKDLNDDIPF